MYNFLKIYWKILIVAYYMCYNLRKMKKGSMVSYEENIKYYIMCYVVY
nr:MAG TPA: hypothetical protein [Caudoviricetes sp.]